MSWTQPGPSHLWVPEPHRGRKESEEWHGKHTHASTQVHSSPKSLVEGKVQEARGESQTRKELPGSPVVKTPCFHCRGCRFNPWSGKFCMPYGVAKKKRERKKRDILKPISESTAILRGLQGKKQWTPFAWGVSESHEHPLIHSVNIYRALRFSAMMWKRQSPCSQTTRLLGEEIVNKLFITHTRWYQLTVSAMEEINQGEVVTARMSCLGWMVRGVLLEEMISELRAQWWGSIVSEVTVNSMCKGPGIEASLACSRNREKAVATEAQWSQWGRGKKVRGEFIEPGSGCGPSFRF